MRLSTFVIGAAIGSLVLLACEADLDFICVGGEEACPHFDPAIEEEGCSVTCDITTPSGRTGEYPCAVDKVIDNCRRCHSDPPVSGAPFSLDKYEDSQKLNGQNIANNQDHIIPKG